MNHSPASASASNSLARQKLGDDHQRHIGAEAQASLEALHSLQARVTLMDQRHLSLTKPTPSAPSPALSQDTLKEEDAQVFYVPTKRVNSRPGITLNPASCASGLELLGGGGDWASALSLSSVLDEIMNDRQGSNSHNQRSLPNQNEEWDDILTPRVNMFLNLDGGH